MWSMQNPYDVLGVARGSSKEVCKKAHRLKSKILHPDVGGDHTRFLELCKAWEEINSDTVLPSMKTAKTRITHTGLFDYETVIF